MLHAAGGRFPTKTSVLKSVAHVSLSCCGSNTKTTELCWRTRPVGPLEARGSCPRFSPPPACTHRQERSSVVSLLHEGDVGDFAIKQSVHLWPPSLSKRVFWNLEVWFSSTDMGDFTDADERRVVSEGRAAVLSLPPISSCPRPQVTWFRDGHKIIPSSRM